ncbi:MAG: hypothetical protein D6767_04270 [Candidatus Hydrogenedentota bacterium]|nr:MAG: hypothetical protein D6767_04270 [Candidatus Hydrogenedentota bacterium]
MTPKWLDALEKKIGWFSLPNLAWYLIVLQVFGYVVVSLNPAAINQLVLDPIAVLNGEWYRLLTFLGMPMVNPGSLGSLLFMAVALWFLYFVVQSLERALGEFKTTFYLFLSIVLTIAFSFLFHVPITSIGYIEASLFLAAATLYPDIEILLFFVIPVKFKWLGLLTGAYILFTAIVSPWLMKIYLLCVFLNYLLFFGHANFVELKMFLRRFTK